MGRRGVVAAAVVLAVAASGAGGCEHNEPSTDAGGMTAADRAAMDKAARHQITVEQARERIDDLMNYLHDYRLGRVREGPLHAYNSWLEALAEAVENGGSALHADSELVRAGEFSLPDYEPGNPQSNPYEDQPPIRDVEMLAVIHERTRLGTLGPMVAAEFRYQSGEVRAAAAAHLRENYRTSAPQSSGSRWWEDLPPTEEVPPIDGGNEADSSEPT